MDRKKVLDKIAKCMRLSKSSEPHEAAAALRQAQKLMEQYGIEEADVDAVGYSSERVAVPIQANQKLPIALANLIAIVRKAFGVRPVVTTEVRVSDRSYVVVYFGPEHRVAMAQYTHTVIFRAMNKAWNEYLAANPHRKGDRGARAGFQLGWLDAIEKQVMELAMTEVEEAGTELVLKKQFPELAKAKVSNVSVSGRTMNAGTEAGSSFKLHRPMGAAAERLKLGN